MKKFFSIIWILVVFIASATATFADGRRDNDHRDGNHGDYGRHENHRMPYVGYATGSLEPIEPHLRIFGVTIIGKTMGHFEDRVVGYRTELQSIYHPAIYGTMRLSNGQYAQYVVSTAWTEMVPVQVPVIQRVWVQ